jgi:hypothetical protein
MKFFFFFIIIPFASLSQINHVFNGNFESYSACPNDFNPNHNSNGSTASGPLNIPFVDYWIMPRRHFLCNVGSADYENTCGPIKQCPFGAHSGGGYMAFIMWQTGTNPEFKEYFTQKLNKPLENGKRYYIQFFLSNVVANSQLGTAGVLFTNERPRAQCGGSFLDDKPKAHFQNNQTLINDGWKRISGYYTADDNYTWITLGDFEDKWNSNLSSTYLYCIDDVSVIEVGSSDCPEWNVLQNISFTDDVDLVYRSSYVTAAGSNVKTINDAQGIVSVAAQSTVTLKSARSVEMEDGFIVPEGGTLHAYIAPCDADCFPPTANAGPDYSICQDKVFNIGVSAQTAPEYSYSWSADPISALAYLSCNNCPNPTIKVPTGAAFGNIKYTLTVTNACGQTATDDVYVFYDLKWQQFSASVNAYNINYGNYLNFDVTCDNHTENIFIEVYKNSDNSLVYSKNLHRGDDFSTIPFHWQIDQYLTNCEDYTVKIYSKNFCNPMLSSVQIIPWIRDRNIVVAAWTNVLTPPNPPNNQLCYNVTGAENYVIEIKMSDGTTIYSGSGAMTSGLNCIWDGSCNGSQTNCSSAPDGTYFVTL